MGRDCCYLVDVLGGYWESDMEDLGWCGLGLDDLRLLEGTGDDGVFVVMDVFEGDVCVVGGQVYGKELLSNAENLFLVRRGGDLGLGVNEDL